MAGIGNFDVIATLKANVSDFTRGMATAQGSIKSFEKVTGTSFQRAGATMAGVGKSLTMGVTVPLLGIGSASVTTASNFEKQMNRVKAISGATGNDFDKLRQQAIDLGADSVFSATEVAQAQELMASAGLNTNDIYGSMAGVMDLASVSGGDMALASEAVATAMNQFGLEATEATHVADIFAKTAQETNAETTDMAEALKYAGPIAGSLGISMEETASAIGIMANAGIKGSQAGTTLRSAFTRLAKPTSKASSLMEELGFNAFDANGKMKPLETIIGDLQSAMAGMTDEQKQQAIATLFGQEAMSGMLALVNSSPEAFGKLTDSLINSEGSAKAMADTMNSGLAGAVENLKGGLESAGIAIGTALTPTIQTLAEWITKLVDKFNELSTEQQEQIVKWGAIVSAVAPVMFVFGKVIGFLPEMINNFSKLKGWLVKLVPAFGETGASGGAFSGILKTITGALSGVTVPIALVIGALVALGAVLIDLWRTNDEFRNMVTSAWTAIKDAVASAIEAVGIFIGDLIERLRRFVQENEDLVTATTNVWKNIKNAVFAVIQFLTPFIVGAWNTIKTATIVAWELIQGVIKVALEFILGTVEAFMHLLNGDWQTAWQTINETGIAMWNAIVASAKAIFTILQEYFVGLWAQIKEAVSVAWEGIKTYLATTWATIVSNAQTWVQNMVAKAVELGTQFIQNITTWFQQLPYKLGYLLGYALVTVSQWVSNMKAKATEAGTNFVNNVINYVQTLPSRVATFLQNTIARVTTWASNMASKARQAGQQFVQNTINFVQQLPSRIANYLSQIISRLTTWASNMGAKGRQAGQDLTNKTVSAVANLPSKMVSAGANVVKGFWNGIQSLGGWIRSQVTGFFQGIIDGAKSALGIHSPSRVFNKEIGKYIPLGLMKGIESQSKAPIGAVTDVVKDMISSAQNGLNGGFSGLNNQLQGAIDSAITTNVNSTLETSNTPITLNVTIGGQNFVAFTDTISLQQGRQIDLQAQF